MYSNKTVLNKKENYQTNLFLFSNWTKTSKKAKHVLALGDKTSDIIVVKAVTMLFYKNIRFLFRILFYLIKVGT